MSPEHSFPQVTYSYNPNTLKLLGIKILFDDDPITYEEVCEECSIYLSVQRGLQGLFLRQKVHPRRLWSALNYATPEVQQFILEKLKPLLHPHDREDPLGRKHGAPRVEDLGSFELVETTNPFWRKDENSNHQLSQKRRELTNHNRQFPIKRHRSSHATF